MEPKEKELMILLAEQVKLLCKIINTLNEKLELLNKEVAKLKSRVNK